MNINIDTDAIRSRAVSTLSKLNSRRRIYYLTPNEIEMIALQFHRTEQSVTILNDLLNDTQEATLEFIDEMASETSQDAESLKHRYVEKLAKYFYDEK